MSDRGDEDAERISREAEAATRDYIRRGNLTFLECAISLMVTSLGTEEVAEILEDEARLLREHG